VSRRVFGLGRPEGHHRRRQVDRTARAQREQCPRRAQSRLAPKLSMRRGPTATRIYDRYSYDVEKREALEAWAKALSRILAASAKAGADVVPLKKRA
jgi:hypothetical protein